MVRILAGAVCPSVTLGYPRKDTQYPGRSQRPGPSVPRGRMVQAGRRAVGKVGGVWEGASCLAKRFSRALPGPKSMPIVNTL